MQMSLVINHYNLMCTCWQVGNKNQVYIFNIVSASRYDFRVLLNIIIPINVQIST